MPAIIHAPYLVAVLPHPDPGSVEVLALVIFSVLVIAGASVRELATDLERGGKGAENPRPAAARDTVHLDLKVEIGFKVERSAKQAQAAKRAQAAT